MCFLRFVPPADVFGTPTENPRNKWVSIPWSDRIHPQTNKTMQRHQKTQIQAYYIHLPPSIPSCHLQVLLPRGALPPLRTFQCVKMPVWFSTHALLASLLPGCHLFPLTNLTSLARETQLWWMHLWGSIHSRRSTSSRLTSFRWLFFQFQNNIPSSENGGWDASCGPLPDKPGHEKVCSVNHRSPKLYPWRGFCGSFDFIQTLSGSRRWSSWRESVTSSFQSSGSRCLTTKCWSKKRKEIQCLLNGKNWWCKKFV